MNIESAVKTCKVAVWPQGSWRSHPCGRLVADGSDLCGPHLRGKKRSDASRAAYDAKWATERAQADYVARWRKEHPSELWAEPWRCPLCGFTVQETVQNAELALPWSIDAHKFQHQQDWGAYENLAAQATGGRDGGEGARDA